MGTMYTPGELVRFGIQIEKNGRDFYDMASKNVKADRVRQVFEGISNDEQMHIGVFEGILSRMDDRRRSSDTQPAGYTEYLSALVEGIPFTVGKQGSELARTLKNDKQALEMAMGFEKDSLLFYGEIRKQAGEEFYEDIDKLIAEEQDHFKKLADVMKGFSKFGVGSNKMNY